MNDLKFTKEQANQALGCTKLEFYKAIFNGVTRAKYGIHCDEDGYIDFGEILRYAKETKGTKYQDAVVRRLFRSMRGNMEYR